MEPVPGDVSVPPRTEGIQETHRQGASPSPRVVQPPSRVRFTPWDLVLLEKIRTLDVEEGPKHEYLQMQAFHFKKTSTLLSPCFFSK